MSLPERIRLYMLWSARGALIGVYHEAARAIAMKEEWRGRGLECDIRDAVSTRGPHATSEIEFRCYPCPSHHVISAEAVDGRSEVYDGCCDAAREARDLVGELQRPRQHLLGMCEHDFEDLEVEHDQDEVETGFNYATEQIRTKTVQFEYVKQKCRLCGQIRWDCRDCECEPDEPCRCSGPCRC